MKGNRLIYDWCFRYFGSTRSSALIRICFSLLIWYRYAISAKQGISTHGLGWQVVFYVAATCMLLGCFSRISTLVTGLLTLALYYYFAIHLHQKEWWHHHTYLIAFATILLAFAPCGRSYSVDRWLAIRRAARTGMPPPPEEGNLFALRLIGIQLAVLYFYAFWDKTFIGGTEAIFVNFLNGSRLEQISSFYYWGSDFEFLPYMSTAAAVLSVAVAITELLLPLMLVERCQKWLVVPGMGLHIMFYVMLPLETYSLTCIVMYIGFFNANKVHGLIDLLGPASVLEKQPLVIDKLAAT